MKLIADLHIHSPYSRATSSRLSPPYLERWARIKGIGLLGSGDCTHPVWLQELRRQMDDAEEGFYVLKKELREAFDAGPAITEGLPEPGSAERPRFVLSGEISTIYKKGDKTRKIHHLVMLPDFRAAAAFNAQLEGLGGNIRSDGRPILGIDSRDLLALLLETDERALLIPAHIWTPWFSVLGAKSGFDSIEECYRDLASYIPAVETGLSSNPPMNWALESLDKFSIISNSDAHSPDKLGREATILEMELSYSSLRRALSSHSIPHEDHSPTILGTIEFFPQEGKYHYDGHLKCKLSLEPEQAAAGNYLCPVCGKELTRGVMGRVLELADRPVNEEEKCPSNYEGSNRRPYYSLIPLKEIISELLGVGVVSKKTVAAYYRLIEKGGSEFSILMDLSRSDLEKLKIPELSSEILAEAIMKMRSGEVSVSPGYDGEYGSIRVFASGSGIDETGLFGEVKKTNEQNISHKDTKTQRKCRIKKDAVALVPLSLRVRDFVFDPDQEKAIAYNGKKTIIIAGPGTGKTRVLTERIGRIIREGVDPASILALTFTVKAASELRERLGSLCAALPNGTATAAVTATTFHSFCCSVLREQSALAGLDPEFRILGEGERDSLLREIAGKKTRQLGLYVEERKRYLLLPGEEFPKFVQEVLRQEQGDFSHELSHEISRDLPQADTEMEALYAEYRKALKKSKSLDFEDLSAGTVLLLASYPEILKKYQQRFRYIFVDEYQDINFSQYMLIRLLVHCPAPKKLSAGPSLWVIGDPNQAIYGFRGSDKRFIDRFLLDYPDAGVFKLSRSFRCAEPIINVAWHLAGEHIGSTDGSVRLKSAGVSMDEVSLYRIKYSTEKSEAEGIARTIEALLGGTSFFAMDSKSTSSVGDGLALNGSLAPEDCAVLVRAAALAGPIVKALKDHGIPYELSGENPWWKVEPVASLIDILRTRGKLSDDTLSGSSPASGTGGLIKTAWEELAKSEKSGRKKMETPEFVERFIGLAGLFENLSSLLDALDSSAASGIPETQTMAGVRVMTIHASKGLEFEQVFVPGLEEGILPFTLYDKPGEEPGDSRGETERLEEEKRLLYVAMTRAKKGLWLSCAESRNFKGRKLKGEPSRFLSELEKIVPLAQQDYKPRKWDGQLSLF